MSFLLHYIQPELGNNNTVIVYLMIRACPFNNIRRVLITSPSAGAAGQLKLLRSDHKLLRARELKNKILRQKIRKK